MKALHPVSLGVLLLMRLAPAWPAETIRIAFIGETQWALRSSRRRGPQERQDVCRHRQYHEAAYWAAKK